MACQQQVYASSCLLVPAVPQKSHANHAVHVRQEGLDCVIALHCSATRMAVSHSVLCHVIRGCQLAASSSPTRESLEECKASPLARSLQFITGTTLDLRSARQQHLVQRHRRGEPCTCANRPRIDCDTPLQPLVGYNLSTAATTVGLLRPRALGGRL